MKILYYKPHPLALDAIKEWEEENDIKVDILNELINEENVEKLADYDGSVFTVTHIPNDKIYKRLAELNQKQISVTSVGFEKIDLDKANDAGLVVTNVPDYSPESIAEFTIMMILKILKRDKQIRLNLEKKDFRQNDTIIGETLKGKTVGIYGLGRIGLHVAKLVKAFGANIISYSPREKPQAEGIVDMLDSQDEVLAKADIISIHSALTADNFHFFNKETFEKMKDGAILVNCARGGLVDTRDLIDAIDNGRLAYAALDVYEKEGPIVNRNNPDYDDPLFDEMLNHPKIDFYQHISYFTTEAINNQAKFALNSALEVIRTGDSKNRVN